MVVHCGAVIAVPALPSVGLQAYFKHLIYYLFVYLKYPYNVLWHVDLLLGSGR
jgi:hypothetical protein